MQKIVSKYALAAHLAVIAVAPLFLLPFAADVSVVAKTMLWLAAFGFVWVLMEPSRRKGEMPHDARARVARAVLSDPLFWFSLVLVGYAGIRAMNGGIRLSYDAELMVWSVHAPSVEMLPGCVDGTGIFPFAAVVSLAVIFQGVRHALGRSARAAFLLVGSLGSSIAAIVLAFALSYRQSGVLALAEFSLVNASYFGTAFGVQLLGGLAALFAAVENKWMRAEALAAVGLVGNAVGLVAFAPPVTIAAFGVAFLVFAIASFAMERRVFEGSGSFRCALAILLAIVASTLYAMSATDIPSMQEKLSAFMAFRPFQDGFSELRDVLSSLALKMWKENPWLGTGVGSFPFDVRFSATAANWDVVSPMQVTTLNGWWQLLVERGVIGAGMLAVALGLLLWTCFSRMARAFPSLRLSPEHLLGPLVLVVIVALSFVNCSFLRPEVMLLAGTFIAFSGGALPERPNAKEGTEVR